MKKLFPQFFIVLVLALAATGATQAQSKAISPKSAKEILSAPKGAVLVDVRTREEFEDSRIPGSVLLPYDQITAGSAAKAIPSKDSPIIVYCRTGRRSQLAAASLVYLGYRNVLDLGGIASWPYETVKGAPGKP